MKKFILVDEIDNRVHMLFNEISKDKNISLLAKGTWLDHAHLLIGLLPSQNLSSAVKLFKGISARRIFQDFPILKFQFKTNNLWARKFAFREVAEYDLPIIINYIKNQKKDLSL